MKEQNRLVLAREWHVSA